MLPNMKIQHYTWSVCVCVFQVVWLWYLTGGSSQLAALFPWLNRLSWDMECDESTWQGVYCKGTRDKSGQEPERPLWEKGFLVGSGQWQAGVCRLYTTFKVSETFPEGHLAVQVIDRPIWINSLREKTMACLYSMLESPKFLPGPEIKLRFHSDGQKSCNKFMRIKDNKTSLRIAKFYPEEMILSWWTSIKPCLLVLPPFHTVFNLERLSSSLKLVCYQGHWRWGPKMTEGGVHPQRLSSLSVSN